MTTDFCAVLLYLPLWDEWIEIQGKQNHLEYYSYLPLWDEWIEIYEPGGCRKVYPVSPFMG